VSTFDAYQAVRTVIAGFEPSSSVAPNASIALEDAFFPEGHRAVLDLKRQLVVGNRGMGKSFWTHALLSPELRQRLAKVYEYSSLGRTQVVIGFNGSDKVSDPMTPITDEVAGLISAGNDPEIVWRSVLMRAAERVVDSGYIAELVNVVADLKENPNLYSQRLSELDDLLVEKNEMLLVVFDALDRLGNNWDSMRLLTSALLRLALRLQSFRAIRMKIFMRVDLFADQKIFLFRDSSKIKNNHASLTWRSDELYSLLFFEVLQSQNGYSNLKILADDIKARSVLPIDGSGKSVNIDEQKMLVNALAGEFMGAGKRRGRVYSWVPLHLSDAENTCSPRTFLRAWKKAAEYQPAPQGKVVDHYALIDGVRYASEGRLEELYEDYPWVKIALDALYGQRVPMERDYLFRLWGEKGVIEDIARGVHEKFQIAPIGFSDGDERANLLESMKTVAVMEERANGKINVPDIFRVKAAILRKGGVAVPRRGSQGAA
jgi:hypothetical protein